MRRKAKVIITPGEEYAYGYIIKALAGGLYPNKFDVIREYIQNGFDAIVNWKNISKNIDVTIKITIKKPSIFIFDNGTGMNRYTLNEYRKVGFSKKKVGESAGFRGIGKLAGISVARKLVVTTSPRGIAERYILIFDAESMIKEVDELKKKKENIPLNNLIMRYTNLTSEIENKDEHYTMIELHGIKDDSKILFDKKKLRNYISRNAPVPFDPHFKHGKEIEKNIRKFVEDYDCVAISMDGKDIYKPFSSNLKTHQHISVYNGKNKKKLSAYCWYCENSKKGQIKPLEINGLIYRYKNFAVGDNYLTRKTIWDTSSHLAFYFIGEVYITDEDILPTSQRDNFEQSTARDQFYKDAKIIANDFNKIARESSGIRKAKEHVELGQQVITSIKSDVERKELYLRDLSVEKIAQLVNVIDNIEKRKGNIPKKDRKTKILATKVVKEAKKLLKEFEEADKFEKGRDIVKALGLNEQAALVYRTAIRTLKDFFVDKTKELENIIKVFQRNLIKVIKKKIQ
ncbi:hypothetical protein ES705_08884 [subsurface metagenome]